MGYWKFDLDLAKRDSNDFESADGDVSKYVELPKFNSPSYKRDSMDLITCLDNFFNSDYISRLVEENKWLEVFDCWSSDYFNLEYGGNKDKFYGNRPGWPLCRLVHFLVLSGIDFGKNLNKQNISVHLSNSDIMHCGFSWVEDN